MKVSKDQFSMFDLHPPPAPVLEEEELLEEEEDGEENASHSSEGNEHYTSARVIEGVHYVLDGPPELDPASCLEANKIVRAERIYTIEDNGFHRSLKARTIFNNPPGGFCDAEGRLVLRKTKKRRPCTETGACGLPAPHSHTETGAAAVRWYRKLVLAWLADDFDSAVFCAFTLQLFQVAIKAMRGPGLCLSPARLPHCLPASRLAYDHIEDGARVKGACPPHASALIYLPSRDPRGLERFSEAFGNGFGDVVIDPRYYGIRNRVRPASSDRALIAADLPPAPLALTHGGW
jgi:hypothetical protein